MHKGPLSLISCLLTAAGSAFAQLDALPLDQQWHCDAAPGGGWKCAGIAKPEAPFGHARRPYHPPTEGEKLHGDDARAYALTDTMDWVGADQMSAEDAAALPKQCTGAYVEPPLEAPEGETAVFGTIMASSEESELSRDPDEARFSGNVTLRQDDRRLRADSAVFHREEDRLEIEGNVQYREPGLLVRADSAAINTEDRSGEMRNARFVMHREHKRGESDRIARRPDGTVTMDHGSFTQCAPDDEAWQLVGENIELDRATGQGKVRNARLEVRGVPVAYTPYLRFPIDDRRMSGLLWPVFARSTRSGFDLALPYYFNLAPNYDATFTTRYLSKRGAMAGGEVRYLNTWSEWAVGGAFLPNDDLYEKDRWMGSLQQQGKPFARAFTLIDYTKVSDEDYLRDLSTTGLEVNRSTHLHQVMQAGYDFSHNWRAVMTAEQYQLLDPGLQEPYRMRPRLELRRQSSGEAFRPDYALNAEYTAFDHKYGSQITGQRLYLEPRLTYPMEWNAGFVRPRVAYQSINYNLDDAVLSSASESPSVGAPSFDLDTGLFFERDSGLFGGSWIQTLEPRAYYLWVDREDHSDIPNFDSSELTFSFDQLFRNTRFSGHDRIADANQAALSLSSRLIESKSGREVVTASIGQIYYFEDRHVSEVSCVPGSFNGPTVANPVCAPPVERDSSSEIAAEVLLQPSSRLRVSGSTLWDSRRDQVNEGGLQMHWNDGDKIINAAYRYRRDQQFVNRAGIPYVQDIDQLDFSTAFPLGDRWKLLARYQYDMENENSLEELAGIEYSSCCWSVRVVYQEGVDWQKGRDHGVYLQFMLRGLGGFGRNIDQVLRKSIFGYGDRDETFGIGF